MYSNIAIVVVANVKCVRMLLVEMTVNDDALLSLLSFLSPCYVLAH
jgi:hypothetical protein